ncbi:hypothetical protein ACQ4M3_13245 [Leptolyngbya sp. AN03gr2]|uniref:hypothetical protein n=1 Tax=unclassified Leptolyngbya TaxID=2650499 RepID=UPI003D315E07
MSKKINLTLNTCGECPYSFESTDKGLPDGVFRCHKTYDNRPNFQGSFRRIGDRYQYQQQIPHWCPLPSETVLDTAEMDEN